MLRAHETSSQRRLPAPLCTPPHRISHPRLARPAPPASCLQIKKQYRKLSLQCHPDKVKEEYRERAQKAFTALAKSKTDLTEEDKRQSVEAMAVAARQKVRGGGRGGGAGKEGWGAWGWCVPPARHGWTTACTTASCRMPRQVKTRLQQKAAKERRERAKERARKAAEARKNLLAGSAPHRALPRPARAPSPLRSTSTPPSPCSRRECGGGEGGRGGGEES